MLCINVFLYAFDTWKSTTGMTETLHISTQVVNYRIPEEYNNDKHI